MRLNSLGYRLLLALVLVLPCDPGGYPVARVGGSDMTALDLLFLVVGLLAALSLVWPRPAGDEEKPRIWMAVGPFLVAGVVAAIILSSLLAGLFLSTSSSIEALRLSSDTGESWYAASFAGSPPAQIRAGSQVVVSVTIVNHSPLAWQPAYANDYALSYHWLYSSRRIAQFDTVLAPLRGTLRSGAQVTARVDVAAPSRPGRYLLAWDMLWHRNTWIALRTGSLSLHPVHVLGPPAPMQDPPGAFSQPGDAGLVNLPITPAETRGSLWRIALNAFLRRPVLGGGPHAFREAYMTSTRQSRPPAHAHDTLLELLDDWGLIGTCLLATLTAVFWLPLLFAVMRGSGRSAWHVALLAAGAAFLAHSTVDYFLGNTSVFVLVCVLSGLALDAGGGVPGPLKRSRRLAR